MEKNIYWSFKSPSLNKHKSIYSANVERGRYKCLACFEELHGKFSSFYFYLQIITVYEAERFKRFPFP